MRRSKSIIWLAGTFFVLSFSSCDLIAGVFKGGVYVGVFLVIVVIAIIIWLITSMRK